MVYFSDDYNARKDREFGTIEIQIGIHGIYIKVGEEEGPTISLYNGFYDPTREGKEFLRIDCFRKPADPQNRDKGPHYHINGWDRETIPAIRSPRTFLQHLLMEIRIPNLAFRANQD